METVWLILAFVSFLTGLLGAFLPILPGPPLTFAGILLLHGTEHYQPSFWVTLGAGLAMVFITAADYVLPAYFTKRYKSSVMATKGATVGVVLGLFLFPPWGLLIGPVVGAFIGEWIATSSPHQAFRSALASVSGLLTGIVMKAVYGLWGLAYGIWKMVV
jgi:uncharacterized protein YqgC (DUF456 family)